MPPKPYRRNARVSSREPEPAPRERPPQLARPQLPSLSGTPSSRRQYSYGSALEPPQRPGGGSHRVDISNAVSEALTRRPDELDEEVFVRPAKPQPRQPAATVEDELSQDNEAVTGAGADATRRGTNNPFANLNSAQHHVAGSDLDSLRSFGTESDYYRDATIASTPGTTPAAAETYHTRRAVASGLATLPEGRLPNVAAEASQIPPTDPAKTRSGRPPRLAVTRQQQQPQRTVPASDEVDEEEGEEYDPRNPLLGHQRQTNTPGTNKVQFQSTERRKRPEVDEEPNMLEPDAEDSDPEPQGTLNMARVMSGMTEVSTNTGESRRRTSRRTGTKPAPRTVFERPGRRLGTTAEDRPAPEDPPAAIQNEIEKTEDRIARERREQEAIVARIRSAQEAARLERQQAAEVEASRERWRQRWAWLWSLFSLEFLRRRVRTHRQAQDENDDLVEGEIDRPVNYWQLLNPLMYLQVLVWVFDGIMDRVVNFFDNFSPGLARDRIPRPGSTFRWVALGLLSLILGVGLMKPLSELSSPSFSLPSASSLHVGLPSFEGITSRIGNAIPSFSWPSATDDAIDGLFEDSDDRAEKDVQKFLKKYKNEIKKLSQAGKLSKESLTKLESIVPKIVHMKLKNGKPQIAPDFWHALRDLIHEDLEYLGLGRKSGQRESTSKQKWEALVSRLANDPALASKLNASAGDLEQKLETKAAIYWESWIKKNQNHIAKLLGPKLEKIQAAGSGRDFDKHLSKIVKEELQSGNLKEIVVTRDEFLRHLKNEFAAHSAKIRAEINELQPHLETLIRDSVTLATKNTVSRSEVSSLVQKITKKALADVNIAALAKGKIQMHWDHELKHQVNYFGIGAGAVIDMKYTSPPYDPNKNGVAPDETFAKGVRGVKPLPALAALKPWADEGDCFCAARSENHRGNPYGATISVLLSHDIVPTHVVIEHILPGATIDPDARPKDIEIWADIADTAQRERVLDFTAAKFPNDADDWNYHHPEYDAGIVKIGQLVYEGAEVHDGVYVHRLSDELAEIQATTDHIIVRAVSNYGAKEHTCFYRVRVFGELVK